MTDVQYHPLDRLIEAAESADRPLYDTVAENLADGILPEQFRRNATLLSWPQQLKLFSLPIFLAGCGGLGGEMAAHLAQLGAANIWLCDFDCFEESNLNRQRFASHAVLGRSKVEETARMLASKAPWGRFRIVKEKLGRDNLPALVAPCSIVIDCLDSVTGKQVLEEAAASSSNPWLHGSILHHEGFACLQPRPGGYLRKLYGDHCPESGAGSTLSHVVAGTAAIMASLFIRWLANPDYASPLIHADFSIPEIESFAVQA